VAVSFLFELGGTHASADHASAASATLSHPILAPFEDFVLPGAPGSLMVKS
jgi:hypothetical protein